MRSDDLTPWRVELKETLGVCSERGSLPVALPHCAICARYATDNLTFEAILSLLDVMPAALVDEALAAAADRLADTPAAMRQQQVNAVTLPVLMNSRGWPLVRGLVIDMASQEIHRHFDDPRLQNIEEITLLGFAYGGCFLQTPFIDALVNSRGFRGLRSLIFHSIERSREFAEKFWPSRFAAELEVIDGAPYFGEPVAGPLSVRELCLAGFAEEIDELSFVKLLKPDVTPNLKGLTLGAYGKALPVLLDAVSRERHLLERVESIALNLSEFRATQTNRIAAATLPAAVKSINWYSDFEAKSNISLRSSFDIQFLFDYDDPTLDLRAGDKVTGYTMVVFDWRLRHRISRNITDLSLLLPLDVQMDEVIGFCKELPNLQSLSLIYPFTEPDIERLLQSEKIRSLPALSLFLHVNGGQWDYNRKQKNEYMIANVKRYQSKLPPAWLLDLAFDERTASIQNFSLYTPSFDLTRSGRRIQHCDLRNATAAKALANFKTHVPIEALNFDLDFAMSTSVARALVHSGLFARVYRLNLSGAIDDEAAEILAGCADLRNVRSFRYFHNKSSPESIQSMLSSPNLTPWDVSLALPGPWQSERMPEVCAGSPLLDRAVSLDISGPDKSPELPQSGRLGRVRHLGEGLAFTVLSDARLASVWREVPLGIPLKARLNAFVERTYRVDHPVSELPELVKKLLNTNAFAEEIEFDGALRQVLATAFAGKPMPPKTPFAALTETQKSAIQSIADVPANYWSLGGVMRGALLSYGIEVWDQEQLKKYIAGTTESEGNE